MSNQTIREKALASRRAKIATGAKYRRDWLDAPAWDLLAKNRGIRLPQWHTPPTPRALKTWHRSLGNVPFEAMFGCSPSKLIELNPKTPLRAFVGQMLEQAGSE